MLRSLVRRCPHKVLGVPKKAPFPEARAAYLRLARELHPDKNLGGADAIERFRTVQKAWEALKAREMLKKRIQASPEEAAARREKTAKLKTQSAEDPGEGFAVLSMALAGLACGAYALLCELRP
mmetsp:Transcript_51565/g.122654  ORF Transcript_51565/g.122654 Transcript_51565/m.122654 type:complete len:124 (-) Transcript_51565:417-788(-)